MRRLGAEARRHVERVIAAHIHELARARGFLAARPGFAVSRGRLIREPAIIAFVRQKLGRDDLAAIDTLPASLEGLRVDVVQAGPRTELELAGLESPDTAGVEAGAAVPYGPIPGNPIDSVFTVRTPMLCHVGPDAGWTVLRDFLATSRRTLTAAMYDFNADYIADTLIAVARDRRVGVRLTIDDGLSPDEREIQRRLREILADRYHAEIVVCRKRARFPTAYHAKVAVRDGRSFWLSSGNWSRTSQPEIDPVNDPSGARNFFGRGNREWHIIVDHRPMAALLSRYIRRDLDQARKDASDRDAVTPRPDVFVRAAERETDVELTAAESLPIAPRRLPSVRCRVRVRPLLSPDNYAERVAALIGSARRRLYLQYSYITWNDAPANRPFTDVLERLGELSWRDDFDLRVIVNSRDARENARVLAENGWNDAVMRGQGRVHNKGIVVDGRHVLVSSQNWSGDGFLRNRDAGLIVHDPEIAGYYERAFLDDWTLRSANPFAGDPDAMLATGAEATPPGMIRMSWRDYYGE